MSGDGNLGSVCSKWLCAKVTDFKTLACVLTTSMSYHAAAEFARKAAPWYCSLEEDDDFESAPYGHRYVGSPPSGDRQLVGR